jgi:toxin-antitoxin system PIN domain toxin
VIAVDTNVLVYAHRVDSAFHATASDAVRRLAEGRAAWAIPWPCLHEFLAIATHPRIYDPPTPMEQALAQVTAWLDSPSLVLLGETGGYWATLVAALTSSNVTGGRVHDARIVALCETAGVTELWSADRDFSRFQVKVSNPLV